MATPRTAPAAGTPEAAAGGGGGAPAPPPVTSSRKLVLLGESAVGKSSLVLQFVKGQFDDYRESTIGPSATRLTFSRIGLTPRLAASAPPCRCRLFDPDRPRRVRQLCQVRGEPGWPCMVPRNPPS